MRKPIRVVQFGLGPLGQAMARFAVERKSLKLVGVVDTDPAKVGMDVGTVCGLGKKLGLKVSPDLPAALGKGKADVALLATVSDIARLVSQVEAAAKHKLNVVSTCEELSFPWNNHPKEARKIDRIAKAHGVTCVGTGVNPGYLMDYLPVALSGLCQRVDRVEVLRVQDASRRRGPFQLKIGAGLTHDAFRVKVKAGIIRHVGLTESVQFVAHAMGWKLTRVTESIEPVTAQKSIRTEHVSVKKGGVCGVEQIGCGFVGRREVVRLEFRAAVGEKRSFDTVRIQGLPDIESTIEGGVNGDVATCAITLNTLAPAVKAQPGLLTMVDLATPHYRA